MKKQILVLLIGLLPLATFGQKSKVALIDQYMQGFHAAHEFSGTVLVAKKGKVIFHKAFGPANREWEIANTLDTRFPIASLTKQFTAVAILQLAEQGKLEPEDKLSKYFPDYPKGDSITIHMLLNHTSGIYNLIQDPEFTEINPNILIEELNDTLLLNVFKHKPFDFSPGTFWNYSNSGYILLGYIIEQVSGETFRDYVYKNLLQKADMQHSDLFRYDMIIPKRASGYSYTPEGWINSRIININIAFSAGGLYATAGDLFNWTEALYSGKLISKASLARMNRPNHDNVGYGYGVFIDRFYDRPAIFHSGSLLGYSSFMIRYPEEEVSIIMLTNRDTNLDFLPRGLAGILFDQEVLPPYKRTPVPLNPAILKRYTGEYESPLVPYPLQVVEKDNKLYLRLHRDIALIPESQTKFYIEERDVEIQLEYVLNAQQEVTHVYFILAGVKTEVKRKLS